MAPQLVWQLKEWRIACPSNIFDLVFPNGEGNPIHANNLVNRVFYTALKQAELPKIRFHDLRHTYASLLIDQGEHPKYIIQSQMGHSSIKTTLNIYGHLMESVNKESATKLGNTVIGADVPEGEFGRVGSKIVAIRNKENEASGLTY